MLQASDDTDADAVRRSLGTTIKHNSVAVAGGRMTGSDAAESDYQARVKAADRILQIETQRLDVTKLDAALQDLIAGKQLNLTDQELKDLDRLANLRKKNADEIYHAEESYQNQLETLREQDLKKYQSMASSIFDALHGHSMNQWFRNFALGQEKQVFSNIATPVLQNAGHMLGGLIPGAGSGPLGTLLHGTIFDPANKGVDSAATTAKETKRTADEVYALRGDIRAMSGSPAPTDGTGGLVSPTCPRSTATTRWAHSVRSLAAIRAAGLVAGRWAGAAPAYLVRHPCSTRAAGPGSRSSFPGCPAWAATRCRPSSAGCPRMAERSPS